MPAVPPAVESAAFRSHDEAFRAGTTSIQAADEEGWVVSVTPSGGWIPAVIAGRTGIGMSQRMQAFVLDPAMGPFNVLEPGKRPRATLTPTLALRDGKPYLAFSVQGGDTQDQNLLQFFLAVVEFGMTPQEAAEAANITSYQMRSSFGKHESLPGRIEVHDSDAAARAPPTGRDGLSRHRERRAPRARSPRSGSIASTARCGAPRRITARTTGSRGDARRGRAWLSPEAVSAVASATRSRRRSGRRGAATARAAARRSAERARRTPRSRPGSFSWVSGEDNLTRYESAPGWGLCVLPDLRHHAVRHARATRCTVSRWAASTAIPGIEIEMHIFVGSKAPWDHIGGDAPQYDESPVDVAVRAAAVGGLWSAVWAFVVPAARLAAGRLLA